MRRHFTQRITSRPRSFVLFAALTVVATTVSIAVLSANVAAASVIRVTNCNDSGPGSLRAVVGAATSGETVSFALSPSCSTITLTSGLIDVATSVTIKGPGATILAVSGNSSSGVFEVESSVTATISGLTIEDGPGEFGAIDNYGTLTVKDCTLSGTQGSAIAGITNQAGGTLTVKSSTLTGNGGLGGGAIGNAGTATVTDSTLSGNGGGEGGGGIANSGTLTVTGSTLSNNTVASDGLFGGGAIYNTGTATVTNSTLSDNTGPDGSGAIYAGGGSVTLTKTTLSGNGDNFGGVDLAGGTVTATDSNVS